MVKIIEYQLINSFEKIKLRSLFLRKSVFYLSGHFVALLPGDLVTLGIRDGVDNGMADLVRDLGAVGHLDVPGHLDRHLRADCLFLLDTPGTGTV